MIIMNSSIEIYSNSDNMLQNCIVKKTFVSDLSLKLHVKNIKGIVIFAY